MSALPASRLLEIWEDARGRSGPARCLRLLAWSLPSQPLEALAGYDLATRDWQLLRWRCELFGPCIGATGACPYCGQAIEIELDAKELLAEVPAAEAPCYVADDGRRYRLPNSADLIAAARQGDVGAAEAVLIAACSLDGEPPTDARQSEAVERGLAELASQRSLQLKLHCAGCDGSWLVDFDPGSFIWDELDTSANALLDDVHLLAGAYGWSEPQVLALSETRRDAYLARVL